LSATAELLVKVDTEMQIADSRRHGGRDI